MSSGSPARIVAVCSSSRPFLASLDGYPSRLPKAGPPRRSTARPVARIATVRIWPLPRRMRTHDDDTLDPPLRLLRRLLAAADPLGPRQRRVLHRMPSRLATYRRFPVTPRDVMAERFDKMSGALRGYDVADALLTALDIAGFAVERQGTHWEGCWRTHHECAVSLLDKILRDETVGYDQARQLLDEARHRATGEAR